MEKSWTKHYAPGVPETIDSNAYRSLIDLFEQSTKKFPDQAAFINMGATLTYRKLEEESRAFSAYLQNVLRLQKGDRVAVMMPNLLQYPIVLFGILRAGMVVVNVNPLYTPRELQHQLSDSGAKAIVLVSNFAHTLEKVVKKTQVEHVMLTKLGDNLAPHRRPLVNFVVKYVRKMVPKYNLPDAISLRKAMRIGRYQQYVKPNVEPEDLAFLQYTGGTTGVAKGAMLSHKNMVANLEMSAGIVSPRITEGEDMIVTPLPLYHIFAMTVNCLLFMKFGCANLLITNPRDIPGLVKELEKYPYTAITAVNTLFNGLLNNEDFCKLDFSRLKLPVGGGMAVQQVVAERWKEVVGKPIIEGYGLTECSPVVAFNSYNIEAFNGSIGFPIPSTDVRIVDDEGTVLGVGEAGELQVRGDQVMKGYWQRPEATAEILQDGWLMTGDIAKMDEKGLIYIVDRKKDMILVSGFNVFPNEVEEVVAMHRDVLECAAVGVPSSATGEAVKLFVVTKQGKEMSAQQVTQHCRKHMTAYKVPKQVEFRDELPKSNVGKILRRELREEELRKLA